VNLVMMAALGIVMLLLLNNMQTVGKYATIFSNNTNATTNTPEEILSKGVDVAKENIVIPLWLLILIIFLILVIK